MPVLGEWSPQGDVSLMASHGLTRLIMHIENDGVCVPQLGSIKVHRLY